MKTKHIFFILALAATLNLWTVACSKDDDTKSESSQTQGETQGDSETGKNLPNIQGNWAYEYNNGQTSPIAMIKRSKKKTITKNKIIQQNYYVSGSDSRTENIECTYELRPEDWNETTGEGKFIITEGVTEADDETTEWTVPTTLTFTFRNDTLTYQQTVYHRVRAGYGAAEPEFHSAYPF